MVMFHGIFHEPHRTGVNYFTLSTCLFYPNRFLKTFLPLTIYPSLISTTCSSLVQLLIQQQHRRILSCFPFPPFGFVPSTMMIVCLSSCVPLYFASLLCFLLFFFTHFVFGVWILPLRKSTLFA